MEKGEIRRYVQLLGVLMILLGISLGIILINILQNVFHTDVNLGILGYGLFILLIIFSLFNKKKVQKWRKFTNSK